jgi:hypothetical protein
MNLPTLRARQHAFPIQLTSLSWNLYTMKTQRTQFMRRISVVILTASVRQGRACAARTC